MLLASCKIPMSRKDCVICNVVMNSRRLDIVDNDILIVFGRLCNWLVGVGLRWLCVGRGKGWLMFKGLGVVGLMTGIGNVTLSWLRSTRYHLLTPP